MPIYEYVCESCQHRFEVKQKMSDQPLSSCARCGQAVTKVISASAIMFKGSGWYVTDYSDKLKQPGQAEQAGAPSNGQKDPTGTKEAPAQPATTANSAPAQTGGAGSADSGASSAPTGNSATPSSSPSSSSPPTSSSKTSSS